MEFSKDGMRIYIAPDETWQDRDISRCAGTSERVPRSAQYPLGFRAIPCDTPITLVGFTWIGDAPTALCDAHAPEFFEGASLEEIKTQDNVLLVVASLEDLAAYDQEQQEAGDGA